MPELLIEFSKQINIPQLLAMGVMLWFFYNRLDGKRETDKKDLKEEINKLSNKVEDIDRRLCRIEGSLATQGHCLFNQRDQDKRAE